MVVVLYQATCIRIWHGMEETALVCKSADVVTGIQSACLLVFGVVLDSLTDGICKGPFLHNVEADISGTETLRRSITDLQVCSPPTHTLLPIYTWPKLVPPGHHHHQPTGIYTLIRYLSISSTNH